MPRTTALSPTLQADGRRPRLSTVEAADYCGVTERYIRKLVADRHIRHYKVGRLVKFATDDLDAFLFANVREAVR